MQISLHIKELRKAEKLTQQGFAERIGVQRSYISQLESNKGTPSEQLILSISREFRVNTEWLKYGEGEMYNAKWIMLEQKAKELGNDTSLELSILKGTAQAYNEILREVCSEKKEDFTYTLGLLLKIFEEGNEQKIDAIKAQLKAFAPKEAPDKPGALLNTTDKQEKDHNANEDNAPYSNNKQNILEAAEETAPYGNKK